MMPIFQTGIYKKTSEHRAQSTAPPAHPSPSRGEGKGGGESLGSGFWVLSPYIKGFTLIELIVVIFIISLATALIMPSFWGTDKSALKTEARHISSALRYIYGEAVSKKQTCLFNINLDNKSWGFKSENESRNFKMQGDIEIKDVVIPSRGEISRGEVIIEFGPMGPDEPVTLHLKKGESEYTIIFNQLNGKAKIFEGYIL